MIQCRFMLAALVAATIGITVVGNINNAAAQSGSRLCGISVGPMAIVVEIKQPKGKKSRKKADKFCRKLADGMIDGLKKSGMPTSGVVKYKRTGCEDVAKSISRGKSSYDICEKMKRTNVGNGVNPYTVTFDKKKKSFTFSRK
jgi:hypothetical protein